MDRIPEHRRCGGRQRPVVQCREVQAELRESRAGKPLSRARVDEKPSAGARLELVRRRRQRLALRVDVGHWRRGAGRRCRRRRAGGHERWVRARRLGRHAVHGRALRGRTRHAWPPRMRAAHAARPRLQGERQACLGGVLGASHTLQGTLQGRACRTPTAWAGPWAAPVRLETRFASFTTTRTNVQQAAPPDAGHTKAAR